MKNNLLKILILFIFVLAASYAMYKLFSTNNTKGEPEIIHVNLDDITIIPDQCVVSIDDKNDLIDSFNAATQMAGYIPDKTNTIFVAREINGKLVILPDAKNGVEIIDNYLSKGMSIIVGVNYKIGKLSGAEDGSTDHYVVIVGEGIYNGDSYYGYFDSGTQLKEIGTSPQNRLFLNKDFSLTGTSVAYKGVLFTVTQVMPGKSKTK